MGHLQLTKNIKIQALNLGFSLIGISKAKQFHRTSQHLEHWISKNHHASMKWLENRAEERKNIFVYYEQAKSVISVAMNYYTDNAEGNTKISNYAWGDDYHFVIKNRLYKLLKYIKSEQPKIEGIVCVDTSPLMEKRLAQESGLGWIGKHTNLITKEFGSWIFLGEILINSELEYDIPNQINLCGSCTKCVDACPTNALVEPYHLDANRCISYLTIEHRGNINPELAKKFSGWIYGCDICQEVCPWNIKSSKITELPEFQKRNTIKHHIENNWQNLTEEEFKKTFRKSAIRRTKFLGLKRNIEISTRKTT